jgi:hypothetical protein
VRWLLPEDAWDRESVVAGVHDVATEDIALGD